MISSVLVERDLSENRFPPIGPAAREHVFRIMLVVPFPLHGTPEKGRKDCGLAVNISPSKTVRMRSGAGPCGGSHMTLVHAEGANMGGIGKEAKPPKKLPGEDADKAKRPPPVPVGDDEIEDGDFATPKRDRTGEDDQPL